MKEHNLFALIGITASGKTELARHACRKCNLSYIPSVTTRPVRPGNENEYKHLTIEEFEDHIAKNELLEYTLFNGNYYGKLKSDVENCLKENDCVYTLTADRAKELKSLYPNVKIICVMPQEPALETIEKRMHGRAVHHPEEVKTRLETAKEELKIIEELQNEGVIDYCVTTVDANHELAKRELDTVIKK